MRYPDAVADRALVGSGYSCEACGKNWNDFDVVEGDAPIDIHSALTWHVVKEESGLYRATSAPELYKGLVGRQLKLKETIVYQLDREDDAFCLCSRGKASCHRKVHDIALYYTKLLYPKYRWKHAAPYVLEEVTFEFVRRRGIWTY